MNTKDVTAVQIQGITAKDLIQQIKNEVQNLLPKPQPKANTENLLTRKETAKLLGVSLVTLHNWTKNGIVKAYRIGNQVRYKESEILQSLNQIPTRKR